MKLVSTKNMKLSRIERVKLELAKLPKTATEAQLPFNFVTSDGYTLGRVLSELRLSAKMGRLSSDDIGELNKLGAHIGVGEKAKYRYSFGKTIEDIKRAFRKDGKPELQPNDKCSDGVLLSLRIDQYRASFYAGRINPKHKAILEELGIVLDVQKRRAAYTSQQVKDNIQLFIKLFKKYRKQHSHGYFDKDFVLQGLNMRDWSERIRRISKCKKGNTPSPEVYQALLDAGFRMTHKECFMEKMLLGIENYQKLYGKLPGRRDRNESVEPVGIWLRKVKDRLKDSSMPASMRSRAIKLLEE